MTIFCYAVFFPAVLMCLRVFASRKAVQQQQWWLAVVLLQPAALLIDHGHFQYNNISLGFAVGFDCNCPCATSSHIMQSLKRYRLLMSVNQDWWNACIGRVAFCIALPELFSCSLRSCRIAS